MTEISTQLNLFKKSFPCANHYNVHIEVEKNHKKHDYVFDISLEELTKTVFQKLGQYMNDKEYKILAVSVQPIFKPWLLKQF